ncbi:hypothetical protein AVEN_187449-1 [Araneus ventricosus]|uniref:Uncharacterized protein n=1 Tax=Araneus ventricosus TaxID=182803 RepID=A0A4Y2BRW1_ARAVE|nr:hypothetical protein AVEN_187449-1 [Araneus ventricosus]
MWHVREPSHPPLCFCCRKRDSVMDHLQFHTLTRARSHRAVCILIASAKKRDLKKVARFKTSSITIRQRTRINQLLMKCRRERSCAWEQHTCDLCSPPRRA